VREGKDAQGAPYIERDMEQCVVGFIVMLCFFFIIIFFFIECDMEQCVVGFSSSNFKNISILLLCYVYLFLLLLLFFIE
jgi:hypothetical protein